MTWLCRQQHDHTSDPFWWRAQWAGWLGAAARGEGLRACGQSAKGGVSKHVPRRRGISVSIFFKKKSLSLLLSAWAWAARALQSHQKDTRDCELASQA